MPHVLRYGSQRPVMEVGARRDPGSVRYFVLAFAGAGAKLLRSKAIIKYERQPWALEEVHSIETPLLLWPSIQCPEESKSALVRGVLLRKFESNSRANRRQSPALFRCRVWVPARRNLQACNCSRRSAVGSRLV